MRSFSKKQLFSSILGLGLAITLVCAPMAAQDAAGTYKAKCAMCHGADGKGDTAVGKNMGVHDFSSAAVQQQSDADLTQIIAKGKNKMPAYANKLSESDISGLVAYVRQLGKGK